MQGDFGCSHFSLPLKGVTHYDRLRQQRGKSFKFEEAWLRSNECEEAVKEAWVSLWMDPTS